VHCLHLPRGRGGSSAAAAPALTDPCACLRSPHCMQAFPALAADFPVAGCDAVPAAAAVFRRAVNDSAVPAGSARLGQLAALAHSCVVGIALPHHPLWVLPSSCVQAGCECVSAAKHADGDHLRLHVHLQRRHGHGHPGVGQRGRRALHLRRVRAAVWWAPTRAATVSCGGLQRTCAVWCRGDCTCWHYTAPAPLCRPRPCTLAAATTTRAAAAQPTAWPARRPC